MNLFAFKKTSIMKNSIFLIFFLFCSTYMFAQSINQNNKQVGLKLAYSGLSGLVTEASYSQPISKNFFTKFRIGTHGNFYGKISAGGGVVIPFAKRWDLRIGMEYEFGRYREMDLHNLTGNVHNLKLPIELYFHISKRFTVNVDLTPSINLNGKSEHNRCFDGPGIGIGYKF